MKTISIPGAGDIDFPDEMSDEEISLAIRTKILPQQAPAPLQARAPTPEEVARPALGYQQPVGNLLKEGQRGASGTWNNPGATGSFGDALPPKPSLEGYQPPTRNLLAEQAPGQRLQAAGDAAQPDVMTTGSGFVKGAANMASMGTYRPEITRTEQPGATMGQIAGSMVPLALTPFAPELTVPAMMAQQILPATAGNMQENGDLKDPARAAVTGAFAIAMSALPPAVGKSLATRAATGAGLGELQAIATEALEAKARDGQIDLTSQEAVVNQITQTLMGAAFGMAGQQAPRPDAPRIAPEAAPQPVSGIPEARAQAWDEARAMGEPKPEPAPVQPPPEPPVQVPRDRGIFEAAPIPDDMQGRQWAAGTEAQTRLREAEAARTPIAKAHEEALRAAVEAENALRSRFPDEGVSPKYPAERDLLRALTARHQEAEAKAAEARAQLDEVNSGLEEAKRLSEQAQPVPVPDQPMDRLQGRQQAIKAMQEAGLPPEHVQRAIGVMDRRPEIYELGSKAVNLSPEVLRELGVGPDVSRETPLLHEQGQAQATKGAPRISFETVDFGENSPFQAKFPEIQKMDYTQKAALSRKMAEFTAPIVEELTGIKAESLAPDAPPGFWESYPHRPNAQFAADVPYEKMKQSAAAHGYLHQQDAVFVMKEHDAGQKFGIDISFDGGRPTPEKLAEFWAALRKEIPDPGMGAMPTPEGLLIAREENPGQIPQFQAKYGPAISRAEQASGLSLRVDFVPMDWELVQSGGWNKDGGGDGYLGRFEEGQRQRLHNGHTEYEANLRGQLGAEAGGGRSLLQELDPAHRGSERGGSGKPSELSRRFRIEPAAVAAKTPESEVSVYKAMGNKVAEGQNTQDALKIYPLHDIQDPEAKLAAWSEKTGWKFEIFGPGKDGKFVPPDFSRSYPQKTAWIFSPWAEHGSFKDTPYTLFWRATHEIAHGMVNENLTAKFGGPGKRAGALGVETVGRNGKPVPPLTLADGMRAIEWEHETFKRQREILEQDFGIKITDEQFRKENAANMSDAMYRVLSGDFSNPGDRGLVPSAMNPDQVLARAKDILRTAAKDMGLDMTETFGGKKPEALLQKGEDGEFKKAGEKVSGLSEKQTETPEFKKWFGNSKVTDAEGNPKIVYHSTDKAFNKVNMKKGSQGVFWVTSDRVAAESGEVGAQGRSKIMELYASIKKPAGWKEYDRFSILELESRGYDGVILPSKNGEFDAIVFEPGQVKSATKNSGTFDASNPDIRFQDKGTGDIKGAFIPSSAEKKGMVYLVKGKADLSTVLHEYLGHGLEEKVLRAPENKALLAEAESLITKDIGGEAIKNGWNREAKEWFARKVEQYFYDGNTDVPSLKPLFEKIRAYMRQIYAAVTGGPMGKSITAEERAFFDKVFGNGEKPVLRQEGREKPTSASGSAQLTPGRGAESRAFSAEKESTSKPASGQHVPGERSLPKTLEARGLPGGTDRNYEVQHNSPVAKAALAHVEKHGIDATANEIMSDEAYSAESMAKFGAVMQNYRMQAEKASPLDRAVIDQKAGALATEMAKRATSAGQFIQFISALGKYSRDGIVLYAGKVIEKWNRQNPSRKPVKLEAAKVAQLREAAGALEKATGLAEVAQEAKAALDKAKGGSLSPEDLDALKAFRDRIQESLGDAPPARPKGVLMGGRKAPEKDAESVEAFLGKREKDALDRLRSRGLKPTKALLQTATKGLADEDIADLSEVFASRLASRGDRSVGAIRKNFIEAFGSEIEPYLDKIAQAGAKKLSAARGEQSRMAGVAQRIDEILTPLLESPDAESVERGQYLLESAFQTFKELQGDAKLEASWDLQEALRGLAPSSLGQKIATTQYIAQLFNPKTTARNVISNEMFYRLERLNKWVAAPIDWAKSAITGKDRTVTFRTGGQGGYWKAFLQGAKAAARGVNPEGIESKYDLGGTAFKSKKNPLFWLERGLGVTLRATDYAAFQRARNQTLGELGELAAINRKVPEGQRKAFVKKFIESADEASQEIADNYGRYATFSDDTMLSKAAQAFKGGLNKINPVYAAKWNKDQATPAPKFGIGNLVINYPKTPANLIMRGIDYSPAGILRDMISTSWAFHSGQPVDDRALMLSLGRAITGTLGMTAFGYYLADKGVLSGQTEKDKDAREFLADQTGQRNFQVNISALKRWAVSFRDDQLNKRDGDKLVSYDWMQPMAMNLSMAAEMNKALTNKKDPVSGAMASAEAGLSAATSTIEEQPLLKGIADLFDKNKDTGEKVMGLAEALPASFVPTFVNQVKQAVDNTKRETRSPDIATRTWNKLIYKFPFASKSLPAMYKTIGKDFPKEMYQDGSNSLFNVFLNPAFVSKYKIDPQMAAFLAPLESEGRKKQFPYTAPKTIKYTDDNGEPHTLALSTKELSELQRVMAQKTTEAFKGFDYGKLEDMTPAEQEDELGALVKEGWEDARDDFLERQGVKR